MAYSMVAGYATANLAKNRVVNMRFLVLAVAIGLAVPVPGAAATGPQQSRDQDAAYRARQQGEILSLTAIRARIRIPGAQLIGAEFDPAALVYRLKFMRGSDVIFVDVDARNGRVLARSQ